MPDKISSAVLGAAGEHLVLSKLLLRGFIAGFAPTNTKDFDLILTTEGGEHSAPIQVKTTKTINQWGMSKMHEKAIVNLVYCFVRIEPQCHETEIFIMEAEIVSHVLSKSHKIWWKLPSVQKDHKTGLLKEKTDSDMRVLLRDYNKLSGLTSIKKNLEKQNRDLSVYLSGSDCKFLDEFSDGWMEKYRDNWGLLRKQQL